MRDYALAWELKRAGMDWKNWLLVRWGLTGTRLLMAKLKVQFAIAYTWSWVVCSVDARLRFKAELDRVDQEIALLCEQHRIKDARTARIDPHRRHAVISNWWSRLYSKATKFVFSSIWQV
jgi:hypothetical protein